MLPQQNDYLLIDRPFYHKTIDVNKHDDLLQKLDGYNFRDVPDASDVAATSPVFASGKSLFFNAGNQIREFDLESKMPNSNINVMLDEIPKSLVIVPVGEFQLYGLSQLISIDLSPLLL